MTPAIGMKVRVLEGLEGDAESHAGEIVEVIGTMFIIALIVRAENGDEFGLVPGEFSTDLTGAGPVRTFDDKVQEAAEFHAALKAKK